jgi:hypothetical protein
LCLNKKDALKFGSKPKTKVKKKKRTKCEYDILTNVCAPHDLCVKKKDNISLLVNKANKKRRVSLIIVSKQRKLSEI